MENWYREIGGQEADIRKLVESIRIVIMDLAGQIKASGTNSVESDLSHLEELTSFLEDELGIESPPIEDDGEITTARLDQLTPAGQEALTNFQHLSLDVSEVLFNHYGEDASIFSMDTQDAARKEALEELFGTMLGHTGIF